MESSNKTERRGGEPQPAGGTRMRGIVALLLSLFGLVLAVYLSFLHMALLLGEVDGSALCGSGHGLGCHAVTASSHAMLMGIPVSVLGVFFYFTLATLALGGAIFRGAQGRPFLRWAFYLVSFGVLFDLYLAYVMFIKIRVLCPLCAITYIVNLAIFLTLLGVILKSTRPSVPLGAIFPRFRTRGGLANGSYYENVVKGFLVGANLLAILLVGFASLAFSRSIAATDLGVVEQIRQGFLRQQARPINVDGMPSIGPDGARVTIVEFSDFLCPFCDRAAKYLKIVAANHRDSARFVFRHFPLDTACNPGLQRDIHPGACMLAEGSACAHEQGKFWNYHDEAFQAGGKITRRIVENLARDVGLNMDQFRNCLSSDRGGRVVRRDVQEGIAAGVNSTPTLFINGKILRGAPKPWVLDQVILQARDTSTGSPAAAASSP